MEALRCERCARCGAENRRGTAPISRSLVNPGRNHSYSPNTLPVGLGPRYPRTEEEQHHLSLARKPRPPLELDLGPRHRIIYQGIRFTLNHSSYWLAPQNPQKSRTQRSQWAIVVQRFRVPPARPRANQPTNPSSEGDSSPDTETEQHDKIPAVQRPRSTVCVFSALHSHTSFPQRFLSPSLSFVQRQSLARPLLLTRHPSIHPTHPPARVKLVIHSHSCRYYSPPEPMAAADTRTYITTTTTTRSFVHARHHHHRRRRIESTCRRVVSYPLQQPPSASHRLTRASEQCAPLRWLRPRLPPLVESSPWCRGRRCCYVAARRGPLHHDHLLPSRPPRRHRHRRRHRLDSVH